MLYFSFLHCNIPCTHTTMVVIQALCIWPITGTEAEVLGPMNNICRSLYTRCCTNSPVVWDGLEKKIPPCPLGGLSLRFILNQPPAVPALNLTPTGFCRAAFKLFRMVISSYWMSLRRISKSFWRCHNHVLVCIHIILCVSCYSMWLCMCLCNYHNKARTPVFAVIVPFVVLKMNTSLHCWGLPKYIILNVDLLDICILLGVNSFQSNFSDWWLMNQMCQSSQWENTTLAFSLVSIVIHFNM